MSTHGWTRGAVAVVVAAALMTSATPVSAEGAPLDTSFSDDGVTVVGPPDSTAFEGVVAPDGSITTVTPRYVDGRGAFFVQRLTASGAVDTSFSGDGRVTVRPGGNPFGAVVGLDGARTLVAGGVGPRVAVLRLDATGAPDSRFGTDGLASIRVRRGWSVWPVGVHAVEDRRVIVVGSIGRGLGEDFESATFVLRLTARGTLDTTYGNGGIRIVDQVPGEFDEAQASTVDANGRVLLAGTRNRPVVQDVVVLRLTAGGDVDQRFADGGLSLRPAPRGRNTATDIRIDGTGRVVVTGDWTSSRADTALDLQPFVARLRPNGAPDTSFSGDGVSRLSVCAPFFCPPIGTTVLADGSVVVATADLDGFGLVRVRDDGRRDGTFGEEGVETVDLLPEALSTGTALLASPGGAVLLAGTELDRRTVVARVLLGVG